MADDVDQAAKKQFLCDAEEGATNVANIEPADVERAWSALVAETEAPTWAGATDLELSHFEQAAGWPLPVALAHLLRLSNGTPSSYETKGAAVFGGRRLMTVTEIIDVWGEWSDFFGERTFDDLTHWHKPDGDLTLGIEFCPGWIPFLDEKTGNYAAIDILPGPAGQVGQVIYVGADESTALRVATDLADFLDRERTDGPNHLDPLISSLRPR